MWVVDFPGAWIPLWQVVQVPGLTPRCLKGMPVQATVLWQLSQDIVVWMCVADFPCIMLLLWHVAQLPGATPL
jgi:hypothetical protein